MNSIPQYDFSRMTTKNIRIALKQSAGMAEHVVTEYKAELQRRSRNTAARAKRQAYNDCGMTRVVVNGKEFYK